jgi:hypothetical protein
MMQAKVRSLQLENAAAYDCLERERQEHRQQLEVAHIDDDFGIDQVHINTLESVQATLAEVRVFLR